MAKQKSYTERFSQPITIEADPKKIESIKTNLKKLLELDIEEKQNENRGN